MINQCELREAIVDKAVAIAERSSWEAVRLFEVAEELNVTLDDIRAHFREKEDLIDAWFDRTDGIMLKVTEQENFLAFSPRERLFQLIMAWLDAMADHRKVTRQMIGAKLEPGHIHIQIPAIMRISRTVQWMREAAQRDATFLRRALEETALTTIYLATFSHWMFDESPGSQRTRDFLSQHLQLAEALDHTVYGQSNHQTKNKSTTPNKQPVKALEVIPTANSEPFESSASSAKTSTITESQTKLV